MVSLAAPLRLRLTDVPLAQRLDAAFGIRRRPDDPPRNRSGVFILALRPVEFSANPVAAYPTRIEGPRSVEDGDIVEGAVLSLIPYPVEGELRASAALRARIEREVFLLGDRRSVPAAALPLAMLSLAGDALLWLDPALVRREVGLEHRDVLGLGFAPRAQREAHLLQYRRRLDEIDLPGRAAFTATTYFDVLPPGGPLPKSAINPQDFSQGFFPPEADVELALLPEDELPALVEESLLLPPIDLNAGSEELDGLALMALIPLARSVLRRLQTELGTLSRELRPAAPNLVAKRLPLEILRGIRPLRPLPPPFDPGSVVDAAWRRVLAQADELWYVRRRNLAYKAEVTGTPAALVTTERNVEADLIERIGPARFDSLRGRATALGASEMVNLLSSPTFERVPELLPAVLGQLESAETLDRADVLRVAEAVNRPGFGEGLTRLREANPQALDPAVVAEVANSGGIDGLDRLGATLPADRLAALDRTAISNMASSGELSRLSPALGASLLTRPRVMPRAAVPARPAVARPGRRKQPKD
jgi:hypothetical protein